MSELAVTIILPAMIDADGYEQTLSELLSDIEQAAQRAGVSYIAPMAKRGVAAEYADDL